jgi:3-hydroxybutyryl-CoA dehydrogenase
MNKTLLITSEDSPLHQKIITSEYDFMTFNNTSKDISSYDVICDFSIASKDAKLNFYQNLEPHIHLYADLTIFDPNFFYQNIPQLKGCFSSCFLTSTNKIEFHCQETNNEIPMVLASLGLTIFNISQADIGFIYPRIFAQVVNEAYFALEANIANSEDIDTAMLYGVNYPYGPFHWSSGKETIILSLLEELYHKYQDKRYLPCDLLKKYKGA